MMQDVIVIGGSYSGMAAALQLARARRTVTVIDGGHRRNRFASTSNGFLTRDGQPPQEIAREARQQLLAYPTVTWIDGTASAASGTIDDFRADVADGGSIEGRRLILAHGVRDELPDVPGVASLWGKRIFHCPYCHGYELHEGEIGVLAVGPLSVHHALMLPDWGRTTFFTNAAMEPDADQRKQLAARGATVETERVRSVSENGAGVTVHLADGRHVELAGLFTAPRLHLTSPIAAQLGCTVDVGPMGETIRTNEMKETTVAGIAACGDAARAAGNLSFAVADGVMAGAATHRSLMFDTLR
ncbi:MAG: NAD(P)/FAD-dependent oxidoreductase [Rhizobiaceae bacterium]|nr:NAD(P)/FAD-dependent oxidoreductase [Rhizobiaceae bacterium]